MSKNMRKMSNKELRSLIDKRARSMTRREQKLDYLEGIVEELTEYMTETEKKLK